MKNIFGAFGKKSGYLGVDIGTASIKLAELTGTAGKVRLKNYGILEVAGHLEQVNNVIQTSSLEMVDNDTVGVLKTLLGKVKPTVKEAIVSLPAFNAFTSLVEIPVMPDQETTQAMQYQARSLVPLPLDKVNLDWFRVGTRTDGVAKIQQVFLVAVPKRQIEKYQQIFRQVGLNLVALELETVSLARVLAKGDPTLTLIVDIGARSTAIGVAASGALLQSTQTDFAGGSLTHAVARGLSINISRAEELKRQKGLLGRGGEYELSTLMLPYLDVILNEAKRVKESYEKNRGGKIERVILSGGGANLQGIEAYVTDKLQLPAIKAEPFHGNVVYDGSMEPIIKEVGPPLAVALGLGLKGFSNK